MEMNSRFAAALAAYAILALLATFTLSGKPRTAIINLIIQGQMAYAVAEELAARNIPFCFASGTSPASVHEKWRQRRFISKPDLLDDVRAFLDEVFRQQDRTG